MDITEEQMPPASTPPIAEKGIPGQAKPDTGPRPDVINPVDPEEDDEPVDPMPDMDSDGQEPRRK
jgi:hypothetical protein